MSKKSMGSGLSDFLYIKTDSFLTDVETLWSPQNENIVEMAQRYELPRGVII